MIFIVIGDTKTAGGGWGVVAVIGIKFLSEQIAEPLAATGKGLQNVPIKICAYEERVRIRAFQIWKKFL